MVARRHLHFFIDLFDRFFDRGPQIPASHVEGYCHIAAVAFPVDVVRAVLDLDFRQLRQRHPLSGRGKQANFLDGLLGIAIGRLVAHHHVVALLADQHLTHGVAAHGRLDGVLYVRHVDSKTSRLAAVDRQVEIRLAEIAQELDVMQAGDAVHDRNRFFALLLENSSGHPRKS